MAALVETETFEPEIYQLEITDPVIGGLNGIDNLQGRQLANRTKWLKAKIDSILSMSFIHSATAENPGDTDEFGYWDSFTQTLRKVTFANLKNTLLTSLGVMISTATSKTTPVDADIFIIGDSTASNDTKKLSFVDLKATLLTYFDTLYSRTSSIFGVSQSWQNVTGSRVAGTNYTNTTGKPIEVSFWGTSPSGTILSINAYSDGVNVAYIFNQAVAGASTVGAVSFIVRNGGSYSIAHNSTAAQAWAELR